MKFEKCLEFYDRREKVVLRDKKNPQKFIGENNSKKNICAYRVDGCIFIDGNKCDYLLEVFVKKQLEKAYFIELKGQDLKHAILQLQETIKRLNYCNGVELHTRIILNKVKVPATRTSYEMKFEHFLKKCCKTSTYYRYKTAQKIERI